jgi:hypothetical protein
MMTMNFVSGQVVGRTLVLDNNVDLNKLFLKDPSPGKRKVLRIDYVTRGFTGNLRIRELNDKLVAGIGWSLTFGLSLLFRIDYRLRNIVISHHEFIISIHSRFF